VISPQQALQREKGKKALSSSIKNASSTETNAKSYNSGGPFYPGDTVVAQQWDVAVICNIQTWTANVPITGYNSPFPSGTKVWDDPTITNWSPGSIVYNNVYVTIPTTGIDYNTS
jgi:hypothetical protein